MPRESESSGRRLAARAKRERIVRLRIQMYSYAEIAARVGVSQTYAYRVVKEEFRARDAALEQSVDELRRAEVARLDEMGKVLWRVAMRGIDPDAARRNAGRWAKVKGGKAPADLEPEAVSPQVRVKAFAQLVRIVVERSKLLGLPIRPDDAEAADPGYQAELLATFEAQMEKVYGDGDPVGPLAPGEGFNPRGPRARASRN